MADDQIELRGLSATGFHGVFDHERREGQTFVVDVVLGLSVVDAAKSDDLAHTVDYGAVAERVHARITGEPVNLIETLAQRIADDCLHDNRVEWVEVAVHKPSAPVAVAFDDIIVRVRRRRES